jgi:glycosyltransferase involved in cell wall biosynthesis
MTGLTGIIKRDVPLVTIGIPTYNRANQYLRQALESARNQTYPNLDIIVSDNCSTDGTDAFVSSIADTRIRYFKQNVNIGSTNNLNFCIRQAKGVYFLLLCDDDLIDNDFIETCVKASGYQPDGKIIHTGIRLIDANGQVVNKRPNLAGGCSTDAFFRAWFAGKAPLYLCNTLFHTESLREVGGFRSKYNIYNDVIAIVQLAAKYGRVNIQDIKASPRLHDSKISFSADISKRCEESLFLLDLMCELVSENRELVRHEGMKAFSARSYSRARRVKSPLKRFMAYMKVYKKFHYRYPPPLFKSVLKKVSPGKRTG